MGPTNTLVARNEKPNSLRAKFGIDGTRNATHGSDSFLSAKREIAFFFLLKLEIQLQCLLAMLLKSIWQQNDALRKRA